MMNLGPMDVAIERLHIKAPNAGKRDVISAVERASWPQSNRDEWVFINKLETRAPEPWLGLRLTATARRLANAAVAGGAPGAERAGAVRFRGFAELVAWLSADLATGRASKIWYWKRWAHLFRQSPSEAVKNLWAEHVGYLPSVTTHLADIGLLSQVWRIIEEGTARLILAELSNHAGFQLPASLEGLEHKPPATVTEIPSYLKTRWQPVIQHLEISDSRRYLAACLVSMEWRPVLLSVNPEHCLRTVSEALAPLTPRHDGDMQASISLPRNQQSQPEIHRKQATNESNNAVYNSAILGSAKLLKGSKSSKRLSTTLAYKQGKNRPHGMESTHTSRGSKIQHADNRQVHDRKRTVTATGESTDYWHDKPNTNCIVAPRLNEPLNDVQDSPPQVGLELHTDQGGLFYLINFLNRVDAVEVLERYGGWSAVPDGWACLFRLGLELNLEPQGPLALFLSHCAGFDNVDDFGTLPLLTAHQPLLDLAQQLYGQSDLWNEGLLNIPAWVRHTPSHLDIYYPLSKVRLPIRLAGLDVNPGWAPWLGRVVTFTYEAAPINSEPATL